MTSVKTGARRLLFVSMLILLPVLAFGRGDWQQRVDYQMDVTLNEEEHAFEGAATITYVNNSPDTLSSIWFRLPPAARNPHAPEDSVWFRAGRHRLEDLPEEDWGDLQVHDIRAGDGRDAHFVQDGSIGRAILDPAIAPGDSAVFTLDFTSVFPQRGGSYRIAYQYGQYKGAYWYPMVAPYTPTYGWTVNRYYGTAESYGEFGTYVVRYHVPNRYIVASTGMLVNENEVLPKERLEGLSFDNPNPAPIPREAEGDRMVTWVYRAEQVPEVAFAMDPRFLIDRIDYGHFEAWAFARRGRQQKWHDAAEICGWTVQELEKIYGRYPWPRVVATDSWSGMEYPMLTMMSWESPWYAYVMIHEVVHNYTPFILHSSSVDAIMLDEGLTAFVEHVLYEKWAGVAINRVRTAERGLFTRRYSARDDVVRGRRPYLEAVLVGEDLPMARGADTALDYPLLRVSSYYKMPGVLNALRSVIGEEAFWRGMRTFYEDNALSHVDEQDLRAAFEKASGRSLEWFFKQFWYSADDIDYALDDVRVKRSSEGWRVGFNVRRVGEVRLPVRVGIVTEGGDTIRGEIPFLPTDPALEGHERWGWWDQIHEPGDERRFTATLPDGARPAVIQLDPDERYWDRLPINGRWPHGKREFVFDTGVLPLRPPPVDATRVRVGPALGYGGDSAVLLGGFLQSGFMGQERRFFLDAYIPTRDIGRLPMVRGGLSTPIHRGFGPWRAEAYAGLMYADAFAEAGLRRDWRSWGRVNRSYRFELRAGWWDRELDYETVQFNPAFPYDGGLSYLRAGFAVTRTSSPWNWMHRLAGTVGLDTKLPFHTFAWTLQGERPLYRKLDIRLESRIAANAQGTPERFYRGLGSGPACAQLGHPWLGGPLDTANDEGDFARAVGVPASFTSAVALNPATASASLRPVIGFTLADLTGASGATIVDRFLARTRLGAFGTAGVFGVGVQGVWAAWEGGAEVALRDFHGAEFSLRYAGFSGTESLDDRGRGFVPVDGERWQFTASLLTDRIFPKD